MKTVHLIRNVNTSQYLSLGQWTSQAFARRFNDLSKAEPLLAEISALCPYNDYEIVTIEVPMSAKSE